MLRKVCLLSVMCDLTAAGVRKSLKPLLSQKMHSRPTSTFSCRYLISPLSSLQYSTWGTKKPCWTLMWLRLSSMVLDLVSQKRQVSIPISLFSFFLSTNTFLSLSFLSISMCFLDQRCCLYAPWLVNDFLSNLAEYLQLLHTRAEAGLASSTALSFFLSKNCSCVAGLSPSIFLLMLYLWKSLLQWSLQCCSESKLRQQLVHCSWLSLLNVPVNTCITTKQYTPLASSQRSSSHHSFRYCRQRDRFFLDRPEVKVPQRSTLFTFSRSSSLQLSLWSWQLWVTSAFISMAFFSMQCWFIIPTMHSWAATLIILNSVQRLEYS